MCAHHQVQYAQEPLVCLVQHRLVCGEVWRREKTKGAKLKEHTKRKKRTRNTKRFQGETKERALLKKTEVR